MGKEKILIIGASGQLGTELVEALRNIYGASSVIASDIRKSDNPVFETGPFETLDILDLAKWKDILQRHQPTQVYHLAALLSATAEQNPEFAWKLNMQGLFHVLDAAREEGSSIGRVYWPSSIAAFGPNTPRFETPQYGPMDPTTVYGISKYAGELYIQYYFQRYGVDTRSLRYPGLIGHKSDPGGGTTDYAVGIYHDALKGEVHDCFLKEGTILPMLYMPDAVKATLDVMHADPEKIKMRMSYNLAGMSFAPEEIADSIKEHIPDFQITYNPDYRQAIADTWPAVIDDSLAREHWGWKPAYDLAAMTKDMLENIAPRYT
ncbi:NAD-dependent epimerase/dehydratase family protein [Bacteroidia bacterium]|nr:NAD-dependent epimerase/dehydratase family protein [Bacteroidia bacterium]MDA9213715.1 NAD-dependent epimerase/dehydratase family protein [Bacteroidia bacterium]